MKAADYFDAPLRHPVRPTWRPELQRQAFREMAVPSSENERHSSPRGVLRQHTHKYMCVMALITHLLTILLVL